MNFSDSMSNIYSFNLDMRVEDESFLDLTRLNHVSPKFLLHFTPHYLCLLLCFRASSPSSNTLVFGKLSG